LVVGTYNLTVTDAKSCPATRVETLTEPDSIKIGTAVIVGTRCSQPKGSITTGSVVGGTGAYTYSWSGPSSFTATTRDLTNLAPGQYILTVKDAKTCTSAATTFAVVDTAANITNSVPAVTNVTCFGGTNGAISLTASGASPLTYAWTGPNNFTASTLSISNLKMGNYTLILNDAGCNKTIAVSVNEPTAITTAAQSVNIKCKGDLSGSIALNATGGNAPLTITWTGAGGFTGTGQSIGSLKAGTYIASITDANNCTNPPVSITITEPTDSFKITNAVVKNVSCNGGNDGAITLTVAGGTPQYTYAWTGVGGFTSNQKDINSNVKGGDYRVVATDANNCRVEKLYTVIDPQVIVVTAGTTDASGTPNGTISLSMAGGQAPYSFLWTGQGVSPTAQNQTGLCPGTYSVNVKDNAQCSVSKSITVGGSCSTPMRIVGVPTITAAGCVGQNLGQISINWEGGVAPFMVTWVQIINGIPNNVATETVQARSSTLINRQTGTYAIKIADAVGQTLALPPMVITGSVTPLTATATISDETCRGSDGSITLTVRDAAAPVTFNWNTGATSQDIFNLTARATPYKVTITDANRCIKEMNDMYVKRTPCPLVITSTKVNPTCFGGNNGSITIDIANGEPTYTVTSPTGQVIILPNANSRTNSYVLRDLVAGTYTITIKDTINPAQTITQTLASPTQITVDRRVTGDQGSCNGSIILTVNGGAPPYLYRWNTGATSRDLFNLCCNDGRRYSVIITDVNGCRVETTNDSIPCNIATLTLDSSKTRSPVCQSDSTNSRIDVYMHGGVQPLIYEWRNQIGATVGSNSPILTNQPPGRYYLTVSDSRSPNPQRVSFETLLKVSSTLAFGPINNSKCAKDNIASDGVVTINLITGVAPYSIRWPDGSTSLSQTNTATNSALKAGKGEIIVTDLQGCVIKSDVTVCSDACATIRTNTVYYTQKDTFNLRCGNNCDGGATVLSLSADYKLPIRTYQWSSGEVGSTAFKLCPNINVVTITDADGKTCVSRINLKAPAILKDTIWKDDKARTLEVIASGGVQPYKYTWTTDNKDTTRKITLNRSGYYVVLVQDNLGCDVTDGVRIELDASCLDGSIVLTPNDDGRNENFRFKSCDFKKVRLEVYNRFGQLVYSSNDYKENWYGNKEDGPTGEPLPEGVYMYVLSATDVAGKQQLGKGTVNIIRN
jgi:large repetitive protein